MTNYLVVPGTNGYDIKIESNAGARHTVLGFATETEAHERIEQDKQRDLIAAPVAPSLVDLLP